MAYPSIVTKQKCTVEDNDIENIEPRLLVDKAADCDTRGGRVCGLVLARWTVGRKEAKQNCTKNKTKQNWNISRVGQNSSTAH